jgi:hypothetical protein
MWGFTYRLATDWLGLLPGQGPVELAGFEVACRMLDFLLAHGLKLTRGWEDRSQRRFSSERTTPEGKRTQRTFVVGPVSRLKTERDARRAIELVRVNINADGRAVGPTMLFSVLADHYSKHEMPMDDHSRKAFSTKDTNRGYLRKWIVPKWGDRLVCDIRTIEVENWLNSLEKLSDGSRAKVRNLMSAIYRQAMRHEFVEKNPITLVRQSSKRKRVPEVLTVSELAALLKGLHLRERVMVLLDAGSGLRRGELFGLRWADVDFANKQVFVTRSIVKQVVGKVKTEASQKAMPLDDQIISDLMAWYGETKYKSPDSYIFATDANRAGTKRGKQPLWPDSRSLSGGVAAQDRRLLLHHSKV